MNVLINGRLRPNVGRVCMDQFVVDLGPDASDVSEGDEAILFGPGTDGEPTAQDWADCWAPSTTRSSPVREAGSSGRTGAPRRQAAPLSDNDPKRLRRRSNAGWLAGAAGLAAVGTIAGVTVARSMTRRTTRDDLYKGEDFELLDADRSSVVTTPDGVDLAVREVGPEHAPLTVVFSHGFCLRMGAFYFQRARLEQEWGPQVRMVFYDQRGHGQSAEAPPDTYTVEQLGKDLETVLAVTAPKGPVVLVGHSMGGMTVLSHARQFPAALSHPHRRCGADFLCR